MAALLTCLAASSGYIPTGGYQAISSYAASSRSAAASRREATSRLVVRTAVSPTCGMQPDAASMRGKELKEELDGLGVAWKGIAFEKEELVKMVEDARANPPPRQPPPPAPPPRPTSPSAPPIETWRRGTSPGLENNFYDAPSADFRKPYGGPSPLQPAPPPPPPPPQAAPRAATAPAGAKFCSQCGVAVTPTSKFCAECGVPLAAAGTVADEGTRDGSSRGASVPAAASSGSGGGGSGSGGGGADPVTMRVAQIKAELKERSIAFSDCFDKDGLTELYPAPNPNLNPDPNPDANPDANPSP